MTLKDLVLAGMIAQNEEIVVSRKTNTGNYDIRKGCWYEDHVLEFFNREIDVLNWSFKRGLQVVCR